MKSFQKISGAFKNFLALIVICLMQTVAFAQETANKQIDEAVKALESGDNAAAEGFLQEANQTLPEGQAKTDVSEAMMALQSGNVTGATTLLQAAQISLQ